MNYSIILNYNNHSAGLNENVTQVFSHQNFLLGRGMIVTNRSCFLSHLELPLEKKEMLEKPFRFLIFQNIFLKNALCVPSPFTFPL